MKKKLVFLVAIIIICIILTIISILFVNNHIIKIGDSVLYNPPYSEYILNTKYITDTDETIKLSNELLKINKWRILSIDNDKVELVPYSILDYKITIGSANGYNNGVYILNDLCNKLYSNNDKNITARSININDIETIIKKIGNEEKLNDTKYKTDLYNSNLFEEGLNDKNKWYPSILKMEENIIVDDNTNINLGINDSNDKLIEPSVGLQKFNKISIVKTYYSTNKYNNTKELLKGSIDYSEILLPEGYNTNYWIASRAIGNGKDSLHYDLRRIKNGVIRAGRMFDSANINGSEESYIFPILLVDKNLLEYTSRNTYIIK